MTPQEATALDQRCSLYEEFKYSLPSLIFHAGELLADTRIEGEPEIRSLIEELQTIGVRFETLMHDLQKRLEEGTWEQIEKSFGLVQGDIVEVEGIGETFRIVILTARPWCFLKNEFAISGPRILATGKPGKREATLFIHQQKWTKAGHFTDLAILSSR
ncbi:MAG: hypothetical protein J0L73_26710 [Verrucomicrobia bacterium]|nr:hypothetical protein [Verrucomicrobiota bacterium]